MRDLISAQPCVPFGWQPASSPFRILRKKMKLVIGTLAALLGTYSPAPTDAPKPTE